MVFIYIAVFKYAKFSFNDSFVINIFIKNILWQYIKTSSSSKRTFVFKRVFRRKPTIVYNM